MYVIRRTVTNLSNRRQVGTDVILGFLNVHRNFVLILTVGEKLELSKGTLTFALGYINVLIFTSVETTKE